MGHDFIMYSQTEIECGTAFIKKDTRRCHVTLLDDSSPFQPANGTASMSNVSSQESESIAILQKKLR